MSKVYNPRNTSNQKTTESSPGGFFNDQSGQSVGVTRDAAGSAADAREYAEDSRGWAVGDSDFALNDWSNTNNSKYFASQSSNSADASASSAASAAADAASAAADSEGAARDAARAEAAAAGIVMDSEEAAASARAAAASAAAAAASESAADTDATNAAASATAAASSATDAAADATRAEAAANAAQEDSEYVARVRAEIAGDSESIQTRVAFFDSEYALFEVDLREARDIERRLADTEANIVRLAAYVDSEAAIVARNAEVADSEAQRAGEFATEASGYQQDAAISAASAAIDSEGAAASARAAAASAAQAAIDSDGAQASATRAKSWAVGPSGADDSGTDTNNAHYWALEAERHASAAASGGGELTWNPATRNLKFFRNDTDSDNVYIADSDTTYGLAFDNTTRDLELVVRGTTRVVNIPGGGTNPAPTEHATISLSESLFQVDRNQNATVTITLGAGPGYTFVGTGSDRGTGGNDTLVAHAGGTGSNIGTLTHQIDSEVATLVLTASSPDDFASTGEINIGATVYAYRNGDTDSEIVHDSVSAQIRVRRGWYAQRFSTAPTALSQFTGTQGVWTSPQNLVAPTGTDTLYVVLPRRTGGYDMRDGDLRLFTPSDGSDFLTNYTIYSTTEAVAGTTYIVREV